MIGKLISFADSREKAIIKMKNALNEMVIDGIKTNIPLQIRIMENNDFYKGSMNIHSLEKTIKDNKSEN